MTKLLSVISLLIITCFSFAQVNDAGLWTNISFEKRFNQSISLEYTNSNRFNENISELGSFVNELSLKYRLNKDQKLAISYRYSPKKQLNNMYEPRSRFSAEFTQGFKLWSLDLDVRLKLQTQQQNVLIYDFNSSASNTFRPRIKLKYEFSKFEPYFSLESFHPVWESEYQPISKLRGTAGAEYKLNNNHSIDCGYMIQKEMFEKYPVTDFVIKMGYKYSF